MTVLQAIVTETDIKVIDIDRKALYLHLEVGRDLFPELEQVTDVLSDQGWEVTTPWHVSKAGSTCEVVRMSDHAHQNGRRADLSVALSEEDDREGVSREIRPRVESAIEFERMFRDRKDKF